MPRKVKVILNLIVGLVLLVACTSNIEPVKILREYQAIDTEDQKGNHSYIIGPGDVLFIDVWKEPELSKQVPVRLDGMISLPLLHDIPAAGMTCTQLRGYLTKKYKDYVEVPEVSVLLITSSKKIYILGEVKSPGEYELVKNMTFVQAISLAGGLSDWADADDIKLIRKIKGAERHFRVDYDAILSGEDVGQNILLQPDDTIFVP